MVDGDHAGNVALAPGALAGATALDLRLDTDSRLRHPVSVADRPALIPTAEFAIPIGTRPLTPPAAWSPGAFQSPAALTADSP